MPRRRSGFSRSRGVGKRRTGGRRRLGGVANYGNLARVAGGVGTAAYAAYRSGTMPTTAPRRNTTRAVRRKRQRGMGGGGGGELTTTKRRYGRKRRLTTRKLQRMSMTMGVLRFQGLNRYANLSATAVNEGPVEAQGANDLKVNEVINSTFPGYFILRNQNAVDTAVLGTIGDRYPLHVVNLTTVPNRDAAGDTVLNEMLTYNTGTAGKTDMSTQPLAGQASDGTTNNFWNWEYAGPAVSTDTTTGVLTPQCKSKYIQHEWYDIRFILYGQRQSPTLYDIMLVKFNNECLDPYANAAEIAAFDEDLRNKHNSLWQGMVRNITFNPILPASKAAFAGMKVLKRQRILLQASQDSDVDRTPHHKIVKWFVRDGLSRNHDFGTRVLDAASKIDSAGYTQNLRQVDLQNSPHPRSRLWLIIRATNTTPLVANEDMDNSPSYDMCIRKKIFFQPGDVLT